VEKPYHIVGKEESQELAKFLAKNGQALLPMVELIEQSKLAVDELMDVLGRAQIEAVLRLSAQGIAGPPHPGKKGGAIGWHGGEEGRVCLKERRLRVRRPRLRKKGQGEEGEIPIPAYEAMCQDGRLGSRMLEILLRGVSTRQYRAVLPEMAETVGVSRSSVSREAIEASEEELKRLCERRFDAVNLLVLYLDGVIFGDHHVLVAMGVDGEGKKHVLGLAEGASENQVVAKGLLQDIVRRGVKLDRKYLFVIDGSKALRAAIDAVFGAKHPVQRCRHHKIDNVMGYLPEELKEQVKAVLRAAFRLPPKEGMVRIEKQAEWLERVSQCGGELAGRFGGDVHRESFGLVAKSCSLPGLDQRDREPAQRSPPENTKGLPLARRQDGAALGRRGTAHDRTEFSKDYGIPRSLDAEGSLG
jgi:putative transposase